MISSRAAISIFSVLRSVTEICSQIPFNFFSLHPSWPSMWVTVSGIPSQQSAPKSIIRVHLVSHPISDTCPTQKNTVHLRQEKPGLSFDPRPLDSDRVLLCTAPGGEWRRIVSRNFQSNLLSRPERKPFSVYQMSLINWNLWLKLMMVHSVVPRVGLKDLICSSAPSWANEVLQKILNWLLNSYDDFVLPSHK